MIAFLAKNRERHKKKVEVSVQQLNAQQQEKQKIQEARKREKVSGSIGCSVLFAISCMLFIIALIVLIPAVVYGQRVFYVSFGIFSASACVLVVIGCCFNDCFVKKNDDKENVEGADDEDDQDEDEYDEEYGDEESGGHVKDVRKMMLSTGMTDSGISLISCREDVPWNLPVRLGSPNKSLINNDFLFKISNYNNLPTVVSTWWLLSSLITSA